MNYKILEKYFNDIKFKELKLPLIVQDAIDVLDISIPYKMRLFIAVHECGTLVSNLGNKIKLDINTDVSTNLFSIMLSGSGTNKDASVNRIRTCFKPAYAALKAEMNRIAINTAKDKSIVATGSDEDWLEFYKGNAKTLFPSVSTEEGAIAQMDVLQNIGVGSFNLSVSEVASEIKSNVAMLPLLKAMAIGYDLGNIPSKIVKTAELQVPDIDNVNINMLMFSSIHTLMKDKSTRDKFNDLFTIQLARRSLFFLNREKEIIMEHNALVDILNYEKANTAKYLRASLNLSERASLIMEKVPKGENVFIKFIGGEGSITNIDDMDVVDLHNAYKLFNTERSERISNKFEMKKLAVKHMQWKALKLSGLFTMLTGKIEITVENYLRAISVVEFFIDDLEEFQLELEKEPYELLVDYCEFKCESTKLKVSKHTLVKEGLILSSISDNKLKDMIELCNLSNSNGVFAFKKGNIIFTRLREVVSTQQKVAVVQNKPLKQEEATPNIPKQETKAVVTVNQAINLSFKAFKHNGEWMKFATPKASKEYRNKNSKDGWVNQTVKFESYELLVTNMVAFSPYHFKDGKKDLEHVIDPSNSIVLDIDKSLLDIEEIHEILRDHKHIIATTSDNTNTHKFRIILELDRPIDLSPPQWKKFYKSIGNLLGVEVDISIHKASMFYGYPDSKVLVNYEGARLATKLHLMNAYSVKQEDKVVKAKSQKQLDIQWDDRDELFEYAYECDRNRSLTLYSAMRKACEMDWTDEMVKELLIDIDEQLERPLGYARLKLSILSQIHKFIN